eukprot:CAMPEP_0196588074 /NCGR_PEP_ID=MMETSP1081-20130531/59506_1 /TAXON_ID=36882 /ORGANISM="Pyramimonas amylifera, Strain CCMP720" /LENGTH=121 /DNA_ID=CAMNT_0041910463 /DNA_START=345 /DNA_END=711 /DNA_ORIENTATION=+
MSSDTRQSRWQHVWSSLSLPRALDEVSSAEGGCTPNSSSSTALSPTMLKMSSSNTHSNSTSVKSEASSGEETENNNMLVFTSEERTSQRQHIDQNIANPAVVAGGREGQGSYKVDLEDPVG